MVRTLLVLFLLCPAPGFAAPVPRLTDADRIARLFGTPVDPDKDSVFTLVGGSALRVRVPGTHHSMYDDEGHTNAPRALRPITGDFVARVRVTIAFDKDAGPADGEFPRVVGGGLLVTVGDKGVVEHRHLHERIGNAPWRSSAEVDARLPQFEAGSSTPRPLAEKPTYLRLTRRGNVLTTEWSDDGKIWADVGTGLPPLGKTVSVGPYVIQNTDKPLTVTFDQYEVVPLAAD